MPLPRPSREAVFEAISEFDDLGREEFLRSHGFGPAKHWFLFHDGKRYDSKAIYGVAVGIENPGRGHSADFTGGEQSVVRKLQQLGFEVRNSSAEGDPWEEAIRLCRALTEDRARLEQQELNYKLEIADRVQAALASAARSEDIQEPIRRVFAHPNNLVHHIGKSRFLQWVDQNPERAREALLAFTGDASAGEGVDAFTTVVPREVLRTPGERIGFASVFLMGQDPSRFPVYRPEPMRVAEELLEWPPAEEDASLGEVYEHHASFVDNFLRRIRSAGVDARDALDAQSLIWMLAKGEDVEFQRWRGEPDGEQHSATTAWIFQSNPRFYDIAGAIRSLDEMNWTVAQGKNQLYAGHHVYIWQSGSDGGVIAEGTVLTDPAMLPEQEGEQFIRDKAKFSGEQLRVRLSIDRVLDEPLPRAMLKEHPVLKDLQILHFANATNYRIKPEEGAALQELVSGNVQAIGLGQRIDQWRRESGYPTGTDAERAAQRVPLAEGLSSSHLDRVIDSSDQFGILEFGQLAHLAYGGPGPQSVVHSHLNEGDAAKQTLARTLRHLLYGEGTETDRLNDVLVSEDWRFSGFGESLATKALAVVYPDRWLPLYQYSGSMGKLSLMASPELQLMPPSDLEERSVGERIVWTNDSLRSVLDPYLPDDPWAQMKFLYWLRDQHSTDTEPTEAAATTTPVWWVNQGANYRQERDGELIWAPQVAKDGRPRSYWTSMRDAQIGDRILHYANGSIRAIGEVTDAAEEATRPAEFSEEDWAREGVLVRVRYVELAEPIALEQIPVDWRVEHGAPFTRQGSVQQGYLYPLSVEFVGNLASQFPELGLGEAPQPIGESYEEPSFSAIADSVHSEGMRISDDLLRRYHISLKTRGFVILSGVSGSGKTWLGAAYARAVGAEYWLEPVAPNWTTNEDLLGYHNPLAGGFQFTSFSQFLRDAATEHEAAERQGRTARPFHVTLDEMNLARVEYYFAKFLSAMEVRARDGTAALELAPGVDLLLTPNLLFTGTVNIDETTKGFSDKVYDRAQLLELSVDRGSIEQHLAGKPYAEVLLEVWDHVQPVAQFAFRTLDEISSYQEAAQQLDVSWEQALDEQLLQKVLPKFSGGELRVQTALEWLVQRSDGNFPLTHEKASEMLAYSQEHGLTDYFA